MEQFNVYHVSSLGNINLVAERTEKASLQDTLMNVRNRRNKPIGDGFFVGFSRDKPEHGFIAVNFSQIVEVPSSLLPTAALVEEIKFEHTHKN